MIGGGGAAAAAFLLLVGGPNWNPSFGWPFAGNPDDGPTTSAPSEEPSDDTGDEPGSSCKPADAVSEYLAIHGFDYGDDYVSGIGAIDWSLMDTGHAQNPFSEPLQSESAVRTFLSNDNRIARAAHKVAGIADDYVPVQFSEGIRYSENWYWNGHKAVKGGDLWVRSGGDVWWLAITDDCEVSEESSIRAICGNPGVFWLRPEIDPRK
jgi:hypothetical protein